MYNLILETEKKENIKLLLIKNDLINNLENLNKAEILNLFNDILKLNDIYYNVIHNKETNLKNYMLYFNNDNDLLFKNNHKCFKRSYYNNTEILKNNMKCIIKHIEFNKKIYLNNL